MIRRLTARELIDALLEEGTFDTWDIEPVDVDPDQAYAADLAAARERTGLDESIITGCGLLHGRRVAIVAGEFGFLGGSIGVAAAERLVSAVERATAEGLPLLAAPASGGTRMQEGTVAFLQMIKISMAVAAHKSAGLPYLVYLRHPTTGGVLASWGSLGHITLAEPGALIGFLGPRVYEGLHGSRFPKGVQTAENLHAHGLVDMVVCPSKLSSVVDRTLRILSSSAERVSAPPTTGPSPDSPAWEAVLSTRRLDRPGAHRLLQSTATDVMRLGPAGGGVILALAYFGAVSCVFVGQERTGDTFDVAALQKVRRGIRLAGELRLPLVTVIDTPGAELSSAAEEGGLAREIAHCLTELATLPSPTVSLLLGQGTGGAALAILPADRVLAAQHGWLAPLPLEGASALVHRTPDRASDLASAQHIRSKDLADSGLVDDIILEYGDAADEPEDFCHRAAQALRYELACLTAMDPTTRLKERQRRYRKLA
ncbi:carboxyl transferase domain-containing protein [Nonomuraea zeae]|uniref:Acetyl-CoA carboxyl transferase n=1 Tax=Nonomuraea zeae TaxID=1642303 RepID=A0A5S4GN39_9ACTN|nr:carboxyl transferase domain-containing protein [Nonomuraea zeae]TMR33991.1 acetyl-CoA carboxyl transferase [Nonomuraea zeae]